MSVKRASRSKVSAGSAAIILSPRATCTLLDVSGTTLQRLRRDPNAKFPAAVELSARRIGWLRVDLDAWLAARPRRQAS